MEFPATGGPGEYPGGTTTGRFLVLFEEGVADAGVAALSEATGARTVAATEETTEPEPNEALFFEGLGVAVVDTSPQQMQQAGVSAAATPGILAVEPERINHAIEALPSAFSASGETLAGQRSAEYLQGFREAVLHLTSPAAGELLVEAGTAASDETQATWGLQAVRAVNSSFTGRGIRVAVLDTGCDLQHPDLQGRSIQGRSFIPGEAVQDGNGHGTHCIGTSMGPRRLSAGPRYGIAHDAEVYAGKVLSNAGSGSDSQILGGINWAVENKRLDLDVAGRQDTSGPALLGGLRGRRRARPARRDADHRRSRQREQPPRGGQPGRPSGQLPLDHGRGRARTGR